MKWILLMVGVAALLLVAAALYTPPSRAPEATPPQAPARAARVALEAQLLELLTIQPLPAQLRAPVAACALDEIFASGGARADLLEAQLSRCVVAQGGAGLSDWSGWAAPLTRDFTAALRGEGEEEAQAEATASCLGDRLSAEATRRACPLLNPEAQTLKALFNSIEGCLPHDDPAFDAALRACRRR